MADRHLIEWTLERVAERWGDPTGKVYERLFARSPDMERLFVMDDQGSARGNMLANVFEVLLDLAGPRAYGANMVRAEVVNHEGLGVPPRVFASFFGTVRDVLCDLLAEEWSAEVDGAWREVLAELEGLVGENAAA
jgi:hemoglobin-like flavoprotein